MHICRWEDRREVCMINSFIKHEMVDKISSNPNNTRMKPNTVLIYNSKMGGVDDVDKVTKPNKSIRKTIKWYKKVYFHLWDHAVYNSFRAYKVLHPTSKRGYKCFLESLVKEILQEFPTIASRVGRPLLRVSEDLRFQRSHFAEQVQKSTRNEKRKCSYCALTGMQKTTTFRCNICQLWFCIKGEVSCFRKYHTDRHLPKKSNRFTRHPDSSVPPPQSSFVLDTPDFLTLYGADMNSSQFRGSST